MSAEPDRWSRAYRPLQPRSLAAQLVLLVVAELALYRSYDVHDARFHWATHFLVALAVASLVRLLRLLVTGVPGPRLLLPTVLGVHLFAMAPDFLFRGGVPHDRWMDVFLGHVAVHYPGGDGTWLVIALVSLGLWVAALTAWLRARRAEAAAVMPPGVGLTGAAVLRPQIDPRSTALVHDETGSPDDGPTLVLLHGLGASSAFWRPVADELAGKARTLVPDLLGFGASIRLGTHFHLDDQAAAVTRLVERHGGGPVVLVAHSYGAAVAVAVATDRPDLVRRLVLINPAAFADAAQARRRIGGRSWIARKTMHGSPVADLACGVMCLLRRPLTTLAPRAAARVSPDIPPDVARASVTYAWPAYRDALTSLLEDSPLPAWLADPPLPTTVVVGEDDRTVLAGDLEPLLGDAIEAVHLPGTHGLPMERPAQAAEAILLGGNARASTAL
jgi:pimeloyl-ACP methyl ester carboxylesterase